MSHTKKHCKYKCDNHEVKIINLSCNKSQGPTGPRGPKGKRGCIGPTGPTGTFGPKIQLEHTVLPDSDSNLLLPDILKGIFDITPTLTRTLTLPSAATIVAGITGVQVNYAYDFSIINESLPINQASVLLQPGVGGTLIGNEQIAAKTNLINTYFCDGSGTFRIRITNITSSSEAYTVYRLS